MLQLYVTVNLHIFKGGRYYMRKLKEIAAVLLLSSSLLINFYNVKASEADKSISLDESKEEDLVSIGSIGNIEVRMEKTSLETLNEGERHLILSTAIEILIREEGNESTDPSYSTFATTGSKVVETKHSCSPTAPYFPDKYYRVAYLYDSNTGKAYGKIDFYTCGGGSNCTYLASITTIY